jgi:glutamine amidotransferase
VILTDDATAIRSAPRVVLPGVGAFANGMAALREAGLDDIVRDVAAAGTPLLGICLGMQMLLDRSEEFGDHFGLGLIPGRVVTVPGLTSDGEQQKIPHIGWNALTAPHGDSSWEGTPLQDVKPGESVYFVHSFMAEPSDPGDRLADCLYGGRTVAAAIRRANVFGCQFHPEKSGLVGLKILLRFLRA